jgi:alpha,alpha-trehalose phosphorylase
MRSYGDNLCFSPRLPRHLHRLTFKLRYRGRTLEVTVTHEQATYALLDGEPVRLSHHGEAFEVHRAHPVTRPIPAPPRNAPVHQPPGRAPFHHGEQ